MTRRVWSVAPLIGALCLAGGCRSASPPAVSGVSARPGAAPVRAQDLYPPGQRRFVRLDPDSGSALGMEIEENDPPDADGGWTQRTRTEPLDGGARDERPDDRPNEHASSTALARRPDGAVVMRHLIARAPSATRTDEALYVFEPPLVMAPPALGVGETFRDSCELRVLELSDHERVIKLGTGERTLRVVGGRTLETARGPVETVLVRAELTLVMGAIRSVTVTDLWVEAGAGVVAESSERVSSLMGVPVSRARSLRRLEGSLGVAQPSR